ncbi:MAG: RNA polymerase sigma factor [Parcubacteria group bacterium]
MISTKAMTGSPVDRAAIDALARDYRSVLLRYFGRRRVDPADVEDAVQEVFTRLLRRTGETPIEALNSYLFQTAASVAVDFHRRAVSRSQADHVEYDDDEHAIPDFSPERIHAGREEMSHLIDALHELPERARNAFLLVRVERMPLAEVARRLHLSIGGVEKNVRKATAHVIARMAPPDDQ